MKPSITTSFADALKVQLEIIARIAGTAQFAIEQYPTVEIEIACGNLFLVRKVRLTEQSSVALFGEIHPHYDCNLPPLDPIKRQAVGRIDAVNAGIYNQQMRNLSILDIETEDSSHCHILPGLVLVTEGNWDVKLSEPENKMNETSEEIDETIKDLRDHDTLVSLTFDCESDKLLTALNAAKQKRQAWYDKRKAAAELMGQASSVLSDEFYRQCSKIGIAVCGSTFDTNEHRHWTIVSSGLPNGIIRVTFSNKYKSELVFWVDGKRKTNVLYQDGNWSHVTAFRSLMEPDPDPIPTTLEKAAEMLLETAIFNMGEETT